MSSPFAVFRQYQKGLLAVFGILIMLTFVLGTAQFDDFVRAWSSRNVGDVAVSWKYGQVTGMELQRGMLLHRFTAQFLSRIVQETMENKGTPRVANVRNGNPGITLANSVEDIFRKKMLAAKATEVGIVVDDNAVREFLTKLSDGLMNDGDFQRIMGQTLGGVRERRVSSEQVFEQLKQELAAQNLEMMVGMGLGTATPTITWTNFNRLNRRVQAEALPLKVDDFKAEVKATPREAELKELFEKHKNDYGHPNSATPGFKQWKQVAFQYFKVDFEKFLAAEVAKITEDEIKKEYELGVSRGEYKVQELPPSSDDKKEPSKPDAEAKPDAPKNEAPKDEPKKEDVKKDEPAKEEKKDEKKPEAKAEDKPAAEAKSDKKVEEKKDADKKDSEKKDADKKEADKKEADKKDGASSRSPNAAREFFVNAGEEKEPAADAKKEEPKKEEAKKEEPAPAKEEKPSDAKKEEPKTDAPKKEEPKSDDKPKTDEGKEAKPAPEPKFKPLAEVRDEVAGRLAKPLAQEAKKKVVEEIRKAVDKYGRERRMWEKFKDSDEPKLDFEALAEKLHVTFSNVPLTTPVAMQESELGKSDTQFLTKAYFMPLQTYKPQAPEIDIENVTYIWWKTNEVPEKVLDYKDAKDAVIDAWKKKEALKLAKKAAEEKAQAAKDKESLVAVYGKDVIETNAFTWMTSGNVSFGMGGPMISSVDGIDFAGNAFMESVFALKEGQSGVAVNEPESIVYVVRVKHDLVKESARRELFLETGNNMTTRMLWAMERNGLRGQWLQELEKEMHVSWKQRPQGQDYDE